jgi:hypothetical protein
MRKKVLRLDSSESIERVADVLVCVGIAAVPLGMILVLWKGFVGTWYALSPLLVYLCFDLMAARFLYLRDRMRQKELYQSLRNTERPFFLVLRSFKKTRMYMNSKPSVINMEMLEAGMYSSNGKQPPWTYRDKTDNVLESLQLSLRKVGELVALGGKASYSSSYLIIETSDDNWQSMFHVLAKGCKAILIIPEVSPGVLYEIKQIVDIYQQKAVVYIPPADYKRIHYRHGDDSRKPPDEWKKTPLREKRLEKIRNQLKALNINLPPHKHEGYFYSPERDLSVKYELSLSDIMSMTPTDCEPLNKTLITIERYTKSRPRESFDLAPQ